MALGLGWSLLARRAPEWTPRDTEGMSVVFSPHYDDETLGAGAAILKLRELGAPVHIVYMTDGSRSHAAMPEAELSALRREEGRQSAEALGVEARHVTFLEYPETRLETRREEAVDRVAQLLVRLDCRRVIVPSTFEPDVWSTDHRTTTEIVFAALARSGRRCEVLEYLVWFWYHWPWVPVLGTSDARQLLRLSVQNAFGLRARRAVNSSLPLASVRLRKREALERHRTQMRRLRSDKPWPVLGDVARGEFLGIFFRSREWFRVWSWEEGSDAARHAGARPRVAIISQGLGRIEPPHAYGSISIWTYETAQHLAKRCALLLIEFGAQPFGTRTLEHGGVSYAYLPDAINRAVNSVHRRVAKLTRVLRSAARRTLRPDYASVFHNLGYIVQAAWRARRWRSNVIHIHNFSQFVPIVRALNPGARIILHMNCEWLSQHDPSMIAGRVRKADAIACCSGHVRRRFLEAFPEHREKSYVVFNGTNVERFVPSENVGDGGTSQPLRVLFVGRISPEKGVHVLVDAFARIAPSLPRASLELVGGAGSLPPEFLVGLSRDPLVRKLEEFYRTDYLAEVKRRIPAALRDRVVFHGSVGHDALAKHYHEATVFVSPSFSDAFPLTVVEAMGAGVPVVASAVGGIPEAVVDSETGLLVEPDRADALAGALRRMLESPALREQMAAAGRARALKLFSWSAISAQISAVYFTDAARTPTTPRELSRAL
jgi:glycosyltransferase involved in cell wall biosynthesis/LmbE family N-acetylglucosaminyl deacetylase